MLAYQPRLIVISFQAQQIRYFFAKSSKFKPIYVAYSNFYIWKAIYLIIVAAEDLSTLRPKIWQSSFKITNANVILSCCHSRIFSRKLKIFPVKAILVSNNETTDQKRW